MKKGEKYGYINTKGEEIIPCIYDYVYYFEEGLAVVEKDSKKGYIDKEGKEVIPCVYDNASDFANGIATVQKDGIWYILKLIK